jgi:hypothetical protein
VTCSTSATQIEAECKEKTSTHAQLLPSLETRRKCVPRIYDAHQRSAVLFGVHKRNERDNFMSP